MSDPRGTLRDVKRYLALDIETIPDEGLVSAVDLGAGGDGETRPYADRLARVLASRRAQSGGRSDFLPLPYHRPVVACSLEAVERDGVLAVTDVECWTERDASEGAFLERTWARLRDRTLVTFHGRGFDLPVLELRSLKLAVSAPGWFAGGRSGCPEAHEDVLELLSNGGVAPLAPLDLYAKLVGLPGKDGVAGKDVLALHARGALDRIAAYCMSDVIQTWLLYLRFRLLSGSLSPSAYAGSLASCEAELPVLFAQAVEPRARRLLEAFLERCAPFFATARGAAPGPLLHPGATPRALAG